MSAHLCIDKYVVNQRKISPHVRFLFRIQMLCQAFTLKIVEEQTIKIYSKNLPKDSLLLCC